MSAEPEGLGIEGAAKYGLALAALGGGMANLHSVAALSTTSPALPFALAGTATLGILASRLEPPSGDDEPAEVAWTTIGRLIVAVATLFVVALSARNPAAVVPAMLVGILGVLYGFADRHGVAAAGLMGVTAVSGWLAQSAVGPPFAQIYAAGLSALAIVGLALVDGRATRRLPLRLPPAAGGGRNESNALLRQRAVSAIVMAAMVLITIAALRAVGTEFAGWIAPDSNPTGGPASATAARGNGAEVETRGRRVLRDQVDYGGSLGDLGDDVVVELRAFPRGAVQPARIEPTLLLAALHLDTFGDNGIATGVTTELVRDVDDGREDGWIELEPTLDWTRELHVTAVPIAVGAAQRAPLMHVDPLVSVALDRAHYHERGVLTTADAADEVLVYRARSAEPPSAAQALATGRSGRDRFARQLPDESPALDFLRTRARAVVGDADTAGQKVARVLAHFARGYRYSFVGSEEPGLEGLADFVRRREGFCTAYAATATLFLRLADVPARVVTGYHLQEFDADRASYIGRDRDAHAWFEVQFEGLGWVAFDATPPAAIDAARQGEGSAPGVTDWWAAVSDAWAAWRVGGSFGDVAEQLLELPAAIGASLNGHAAGVIAAAAGAFALALWIGRRLVRRRQRDRMAPGDDGPAGGAAATDWYRDLLRELARLGFPRRPSTTPREHAAALGPHAEQPAVAATVESLYRERFAARDLSDGERREVEALLSRLRDRLPESSDD